MEKVTVDDVDTVPHLMGANTNRRPLSRAIDGMDFAVVVFELGPGEAFSGALHKHLNQQELFYILEGTATWELKEGPGATSELVEVGPNEVIHFHEDDVFQTGTNQTDGVVEGIAFGAPGARHEWEQARGLVECPQCGEETIHTFTVVDGAADVRMPAPDEMAIACQECGNEL